MGHNYTALVVWSDFLVRCQIIKANEESGGSAGMEATVMVHVAMADTFGFHGNGKLSDWQEPTAGFTALDGHFEFSIYTYIFSYIYKNAAGETTCGHKHNLGSRPNKEIRHSAQCK